MGTIQIYIYFSADGTVQVRQLPIIRYHVHRSLQFPLHEMVQRVQVDVCKKLTR